MLILEIALIALAIFILLAAALVYRWRGPEDSVALAVMRTLNQLLVRVVHRLEIVGSDPLPPEGPCIVVANHRSAVDPNLVGAATRRWIHYMMAREYFEMWSMRWIYRSLGSIPVNRDGNDLAATRRALKALKAGRVVGIFPQGGIREPDDDLDVAKSGVALLAMRAGAPIVPFYVDGSPVTESAFLAIIKPSRSRVFCGQPIRPRLTDGKPSRQDMENFTSEVLQSILALKKRAEDEGGEKA